MYKKAAAAALLLVTLIVPAAAQAETDLSGVTTLSPTGNVTIDDYREPIDYRVEVNWTEAVNPETTDGEIYELNLALADYEKNNYQDTASFEQGGTYGLLNTTTDFNNIFTFVNTTTLSLPERDIVVLAGDNTTGYIESNPPFDYRKAEVKMDITYPSNTSANLSFSDGSTYELSDGLNEIILPSTISSSYKISLQAEEGMVDQNRPEIESVELYEYFPTDVQTYEVTLPASNYYSGFNNYINGEFNVLRGDTIITRPNIINTDTGSSLGFQEDEVKFNFPDRDFTSPRTPFYVLPEASDLESPVHETTTTYTSYTDTIELTYTVDWDALNAEYNSSKPVTVQVGISNMSSDLNEGSSQVAFFPADAEAGDTLGDFSGEKTYTYEVNATQLGDTYDNRYVANGYSFYFDNGFNLYTKDGGNIFKYKVYDPSLQESPTGFLFGDMGNAITFLLAIIAAAIGYTLYKDITAKSGGRENIVRGPS